MYFAGAGQAIMTVAGVAAVCMVFGLPAWKILGLWLEKEISGPEAIVSVGPDSGDYGTPARFKYGGMLYFQRGLTPTHVGAPQLCVVYTGRSAATGPRVQQYLAWDGRASFIRTSTALVDGFASDPIRILDANRILLELMTKAAGIDYRTPEIDAIVRLALARGGAAKASGAGGGDSVVALLPDEDAVASFTRAVRAAGFVMLATDLAPGVGPAPTGA